MARRTESKTKQKKPLPAHLWKKGTSGNPGGRPKSSLASALAAYGEKRRSGAPGNHAQALAEVAWTKALEGDLDWAEWLGKHLIPQQFAVGGPDGGNLVTPPILALAALSTDKLLKLVEDSK